MQDQPAPAHPTRLISPFIFIALLSALGFSSPAAAASITLSLANSGINQFQTPFPLIRVTGASTQPVVSPLGSGAFGYDFVVDVLNLNQGGSKVTGAITFDFGTVGTFVGTLTEAAFSTPPVMDPATGFRTVILNAPFNLTSGTGLFAGAIGTGSLFVTTLRATDTSPTATFTSTGSVTVVTTPEPASLTLLGSGIAGLVAAARRRRRATSRV